MYPHHQLMMDRYYDVEDAMETYTQRGYYRRIYRRIL